MASNSPTNGNRKWSGPAIWVRELVLFDRVDPIHEINRFDFVRGLNIIQGTSSDSSDTFESGHGVGKTTVCRLIRFCLGEKTYGQEHVVDEIRNGFPHAHVGAVIEVQGTVWAIVRGLGKRGKQLAKMGMTPEKLIASDGKHPYSDFVAAVDAAALDGFGDRAILSGGQSVRWLNLLGLCSRDQESRYDRFWNWRPKRSDSGTPNFNKSKVDAGLFVRAIIGLLDPAEPILRSRIESLEQSVDQAQDDIRDKQLEPSLQIKRLRTELVNQYEIADADEAPIEQDELFGVLGAIVEKLKRWKAELAEIDAQIPPLDRRIVAAGIARSELLEMANQEKAASTSTLQGNDTMTGAIDHLREKLDFIDGLEFKPCNAGGVLVGECSIVQANRASIEVRLRKKQKATMPEIVRREQQAARLSEQAERKQTPLERLTEQLDGLTGEKNALVARQTELGNRIEQLPKLRQELTDWNDIVAGRVSNDPLSQLIRDEKRTVADIETAKAELKTLVANQSKRARKFAAGFDLLVGETIDAKFRGYVDITEDAVTFRINRENSLGGEAYETLAVLLADLSLLLAGKSPSIHHPGLLIHDSPREADLNIRIYQRLLEVAAEQMNAAGVDPPYQYIVTTTTPPSGTVAKAAKMHRLSSGSGSLFGKQLEGPQPDEQGKLFDTDGDDDE